MQPVLFSVNYAGLWGQAQLSLEEFIPHAAELGYPAVELTAKRPHLSALRRWQDACREHAEQVGGDWRAIARQARILTPWSRDYLRAEGRDDLADYYDGLRADHPDA